MEATLTKLEKPLLRVGSQGFEVIELHLLLQSYGLTISIDGEVYDFFGQFTKHAVINFQDAMFLPVDGIVGNQTWLALYQKSPIEKPNLQQGSRGESVKQLQNRLKQLQYNVGAIDGIFGPRTQQAVIEFQQDFQFIPDGKVDEASWKKLAELRLKMFAQIPQVEVFNNRQLRIYRGGQLKIVDITKINFLILDYYDPYISEVVAEQELYGMYILGEPTVNSETKDIAVRVVLNEYADIQQSAVFIISGEGGYYRLQVPGKRSLPNEFASYPLSTIYALDYSHGNLLVMNGDNSDNSTVMLVFKPGKTPAGQYVGCVRLGRGEGRNLCPQTS